VHSLRADFAQVAALAGAVLRHHALHQQRLPDAQPFLPGGAGSAGFLLLLGRTWLLFLSAHAPGTLRAGTVFLVRYAPGFYCGVLSLSGWRRSGSLAKSKLTIEAGRFSAR